MANLNPQKYCFHGHHSKLRANFRILPGVNQTRMVCAECYDKIMTEMKPKKVPAPR